MSRRYRYTSDDVRYYPEIGLTAEPGETYELERNPDEARFTFVRPKPAKKADVEKRPDPPADRVTPSPALTEEP